MMAQSFYDRNQDDERRLKSPALRQVAGGDRAESRVNPGQLKQRNRRSRLLGSTIALIVLVFAGFIALLYNQSRVIEVTARNASLQYQINELKKSNAQRREAISKSLDLNTIRREAERMGLRMPVEGQIIEVKQSMRDEIVTHLRSANAEGVDVGEADMAEIFANVEGFFKSIH